MPRVPSLDDDDYLEIEEAIACTARGRAFLRTRDRRASLIAADERRKVVVELANLLDSRQRAGAVSIDVLQRDLKELRDHIERSKGEIAALVGKDGKALSAPRLNGATEELYEIVASTERATSEILEATEWIQERVTSLGLSDAERQEFDQRCMEIFTACSFQDITGQRIAKVVATMSYVEQRVITMMSMWGTDATDHEPPAVRTTMDGNRSRDVGEASAVPDAESSLLNGPQLPGHGLGQDAVDALFGGSDASTAETKTPPPAKPVPPEARPAPKAEASAPPAPKQAAKPAVAKKSAPPPAPPSLAPAASAAKLDQSAVDALFN